MKVSYSKVNTFNECPYKYKLVYMDHLEPKFDERPANALALGTACHTGIEERDIDKAIENYKSNYSVWGKANEVEVHKLRKVLELAIRDIPHGEYEHKLDVPDEFVGYIDEIVENDDGTVTLLDYKYSNNLGGYKKSGQLHLYKYYYERLTGKKVKNIFYVFIPKLSDNLNEDFSNYDKVISKIDEDVKDKKILFEEVKFEPQQVNFFFARKTLLEKATEYPKRYTEKCKWCQFRLYCQTNGANTSEIKQKEVKSKHDVEEVSLF